MGLFPNLLSKEIPLNNTYAPVDGQPFHWRPTTSHDVQVLCDLVHYIRAWWETFNYSLRQLDPVAARKGYDAIIEATITARRIARGLGLPVPDFSDINWSASPVPAEHAASASDL